MSERHTAGGLEHMPVRTGNGGARSASARVSDARPFKPYVYNGGEKEPPAVTAARERHRELTAEIKAARAALVMPDPAPGYEWHRELNEAFEDGVS